MSFTSCCFTQQLKFMCPSWMRSRPSFISTNRSLYVHQQQPWIAWKLAHSYKFSTTGAKRDSDQSVPPVIPLKQSITRDAASTTPASTDPSDPKVHHVADEQLPSHRRRQQWTLSTRLHALMDRATARLTLASQRINNYTGTDYSGIEALRREIAEQEQLVRARYAALQLAKTELNGAQERRTASATDLVALLERKHSWTSPDLEQYMALVRSEHTNDKAVQTAKEKMDRAEQALEDARIRLEKRERAQYHEEQIWSDTIRRNSTWVTIGLMGLNILILLFNLVIIEPWRRRRLVREVRTALEEKAGSSIALIEGREAAILLGDGIVEETDISSSATEDSTQIVEEIVEPPQDAQPTVADDNSPVVSLSWQTRIKIYVKSFFSDKIITMQMMELTAIAIQSAAGGATVAWLLVLLMLIPY